jgi:hypothetical protein
LWITSGEVIFSTTGKPISLLKVTAWAFVVASFDYS